MTTAADFDKKYDIIDESTPRHSLMTGRYKRSFAYYTLRERLPVIITAIIDSMNKDKDELVAQYGESSREEIKNVLGLLSKLKYELQTDKLLEDLTGNEPDKDLWNDFLATLPIAKRTFFRTCWLYAECYMYRKIRSYFEPTQTLNNFDYFGKQKRNAITCSIESIKMVAQCTRNIGKDAQTFKRLLKLNLWGNRCDLSISIGKEIKQTGNQFELVDSFDSNVLIDETQAVWDCITENIDNSSPIVVDFIFDNSGYELFTDLIMADYIIECKLAAKVRFHAKALPWFISDVTPTDFYWTLEFLREHSSTVLRELGQKWTEFVKVGTFELLPMEYFWTSGYEFYRMRDVNPALYAQLSEAHLIIFKGDLNYRKLLGDFTWDDTEDFVTCLRGFLPSNICTLRTVKADLICGLKAGLHETLTKAQPNWMVTGEYGVIQFAGKIANS